MKANWDEIPSLENLKIDWDYEPENPLGKRSTVRLSKKNLFRLLGEEFIPVKIASKNIDGKGHLIDISAHGIAILLENEMKVGTLVRVGFYLGKRKIISRAIIRNISKLAGNYRTGIEFIKLDEELALYINTLNASAIYRN